ncbi:MAG: hypothetical protein E7537_05390 [Ruminococcaceae bacterium]|nr:hypothetical protein [Oscillospiraceae bacterium]
MAKMGEFDISEFVVKGTNTVTAKVRKWCSGSYLEDQDFFRFNGIFRDVYVLSRPRGHVKDIKIFTEENVINIEMDGPSDISLFDPEGKLLAKEYAFGMAQFAVQNPIMWNAEKPYLYELLFEYEGEVISQKVGFVSYKIGKDNEFLVNGVEVKLKGVNHHDTHPEKGWTMNDEEIRHDLMLMKKLNINTVRTSHYPQSHTFVDYLDRDGLCSWLEIPMWQFHEPSLASEFVRERAKKLYNEMVEQYYNHPSIIIWGLHNEVETNTKAGYEFTKMAYGYVKEMDNSRLISFASDRFVHDISLEFCDIVALNNYFGWYYGEESDWEAYIKGFRSSLNERGFGDKPVMMSEFGVPAMIGISSFEKEKWSMQYQAEYVERVIKLCAEEECVCGSAVWVLFDFQSANDLMKARGFNNKGLMNEYRKPKLAYYKVKELYKNIK